MCFSQVAHVVFDTKKEMCKAIYALSGTLNHAIAIKDTFIREKTDIFLNTLNTWRASGSNDLGSLRAAFAKPRSETRHFSSLMFPPVQFPQDEFETYFARFCHSLMLPVSYRDLENLDPIVPTPGQKAGYLFHKNRNGEWGRQYFYIMPKGMLMQFAKGKDIQVANLTQTLLRTINDESRDFVFEICSIEVYLMESILQAATKVEYEEWKAALFYWHPPDEDIPQIDTLKISTPPTKHALPRPRHISMGRAPDRNCAVPKPRPSAEFPIVFKGDLFVLDLRAKPMNAQTIIGTWKRINCCIRSNGHFAQYNVGESDKPFETIPLAETLRTHIWPLDGSLFAKKHCFSIKGPQEVNYYTVSLKRSNTDQDTFNAWLYALKSYAKPELFGANEQLEYRLYRTFWIHVNDGRRLPKDLEAYCEIILDDQRRARTGTRMKTNRSSDPDAPFWRDGFEFTDLAAFSKGITINVIQTKGSKRILFGRTHIPARNSEECDEGWYPILAMNNRTGSNEHLGDLRLKLKYEEQFVLPLENYSRLLQIIINFRENNVISRLAECVPDLEAFSKNVLRILEGNDRAVVWLNTLIDQEIGEAKPTRVNTLFRGNTLLTKALDAYMRLVGTEYLDETLGDILRDICKNKIACEVDPSKLERHDDIKSQWRILMTHTRRCWRAVTESVDRFPKDLLLVFSHLQQRLTEKFPDLGPSGEPDPECEHISLARYTGVSGFVFLRLICPAILGPRLFYIVREHPEPRAHRTLTLIAKSLQGLANLVMFGAKESWMVPMNEFITENTKSLKDFIDQICVAEPMSGRGSSSNSVRSLQMQQPPHSPGSTHSGVFRSSQQQQPQSQQQHNKNGNNGYQNNSSGFGPSLSGSFSSTSAMMAMAPLPSPSSQTYGHSRFTYRQTPSSKEVVLPPIGNVDQATMDRNQDMPQLPHMIDLGMELANFATTVARSVSPWPENGGQEEEEEAVVIDRQDQHKQGSTSDSSSQQPQAQIPSSSTATTQLQSKDISNDSETTQNGNKNDHKDDEDDILLTVSRASWEVIEIIRDRVRLSVEFDQDGAQAAGESAASAIQGGSASGSASGSAYSGQEFIQRQQHQQQQQQKLQQQHGCQSKSKVSRDGEDNMVYEYYDVDPDAESFCRGYDSDEDSFEQRSGHDSL
ncbi:hypothetical protein BGX28_009454 [Mortierella sp. GBA30]|nr:hypothetical protein BGX28_009454 [Mortierella sp. GBA30]